MGIVTGIIVFLLIWWTVLFAVLPWGVRPNSEGPEKGIQAAPENPMLARKFLITTGVSFLLWGVVFALVRADVISFRQISEQMMAEDQAQ